PLLRRPGAGRAAPAALPSSLPAGEPAGQRAGRGRAAAGRGGGGGVAARAPGGERDRTGGGDRPGALRDRPDPQPVALASPPARGARHPPGAGAPLLRGAVRPPRGEARPPRGNRPRSGRATVAAAEGRPHAIRPVSALRALTLHSTSMKR